MMCPLVAWDTLRAFSRLTDDCSEDHGTAPPFSWFGIFQRVDSGDSGSVNKAGFKAALELMGLPGIDDAVLTKVTNMYMSQGSGCNRVPFGSLAPPDVCPQVMSSVDSGNGSGSIDCRELLRALQFLRDDDNTEAVPALLFESDDDKDEQEVRSPVCSC